MSNLTAMARAKAAYKLAGSGDECLRPLGAGLNG